MFRLKRSRLTLLFAILLLALFGNRRAVAIQQTASDTASQSSQQSSDTISTALSPLDIALEESRVAAEAQPGGIARNFKEWTKQGGWVMYPIYGVFVLGLGVVIYQFVKIFFDQRYSRPVTGKRLLERDEGTDVYTRVNEIWATVRQYPSSNLAKLLDKLCELWRRDPSAEVLQAEIAGYLHTVKARYEIGKNFATLLSDTAGALGLLGTVLGMYQTFMPGRLESAQIISGMGVALVTTIGGLIVSIILNFAISWANSTFHRHMEWVEEQADMFRYRFGRGQAVHEMHPVAAVTAALNGPKTSGKQNSDAPKISPPRRMPANMKILSGNLQTAAAGGNLPKALEVAVEDQFGKPLENFPVLFETNGTSITFDNDKTAQQVETDFLGRAKVQARLGKLVGRHQITARANGESNLRQDFEIESRPGLPDQLNLLSGSFQISPPGSPLPEPLRLKVEDACGNPVPDQIVIFEVVHNKGRLEQGKTRVEARTNDEGIASVNFRLAETPGANIVKAWVKSKSARKLEASFECMGRE